VFAYPCTSASDGTWKVVEELKLDEFGQKKFKASLDELLQEQDVVKDLLPG
jgi:malate dehydrogenase